MEVVNFNFSGDDISNSESTLHLTPFGINYSGPARVKTFFNITSNKDQIKNDNLNSDETPDNEEEILDASFRGRIMKGKQIQLEKNYTGIVVEETKQFEDEFQMDFEDEKKPEKNYTVTQHFNNFNYWNYEIPPSKNDKVIKWLDFVKLSENLHNPVSNEEINENWEKEEKKKEEMKKIFEIDEKKEAEEIELEKKEIQEEEEKAKKNSPSKKRKISPSKNTTKKSPESKKRKISPVKKSPSLSAVKNSPKEGVRKSPRLSPPKKKND